MLTVHGGTIDLIQTIRHFIKTRDFPVGITNKLTSNLLVDALSDNFVRHQTDGQKGVRDSLHAPFGFKHKPSINNIILGLIANLGGPVDIHLTDTNLRIQFAQFGTLAVDAPTQ